MLVCNICEIKAKYRVIIDCGKFTDRLFFCEEHKPQSMFMGKMDDKQHDTNINTILTTLASPTFPTEKAINKDLNEIWFGTYDEKMP